MSDRIAAILTDIATQHTAWHSEQSRILAAEVTRLRALVADPRAAEIARLMRENERLRQERDRLFHSYVETLAIWENPEEATARAIRTMGVDAAMPLGFAVEALAAHDRKQENP